MCQHELALEVRAPKIVWRGGNGQRGALGMVLALTAVGHQAIAIENRVHRADG